MLAARGYKLKSDLKKAKGTTFRFTETSIFGPEYTTARPMPVVGPSPTDRRWYATVTVDGDGIILKVT